MLILVFLYSSLTVVIAVTLFGFFGRIWWVFELFSHFRVQYCLAMFVLGLVFLLSGEPIPGGVAMAFALLNMALIAPLYARVNTQMASGERYRLLHVNLNTANPHHAKVRRFTQEVSPDLVVLIEVDQGWLDDLGLDEVGYPHRVAEPREDNYGIALYSRFPFISSEVVRFGPLGMPSVFARLPVGGSVLNVIGSHPPPPKSGQLARYRDQQIAEIMEHARSLEGGVIFCGDLNMTSWSPAFKGFLAQGDLLDTRQGFGVQPTWPTWMPLLLVPLDHIWVSRNVRIHSRRVGPRVGSDHRPVILDFSVHSYRPHLSPG